MTQLRAVMFAGLLLSPALAIADSEEVFRCHFQHFLRTIPGEQPELRLTVVTFNNGDLQHEAVIRRLTVRDAFGAVQHDSGPAIGVDHPLNLGVQDITTVPPGGTFNFSTSDLWGSSDPSFATTSPPLTSAQKLVLLGGLSITVTVRHRNPRQFVAHAHERARVPPFGGGPAGAGSERSAKTAICFHVRDRA